MIRQQSPCERLAGLKLCETLLWSNAWNLKFIPQQIHDSFSLRQGFLRAAHHNIRCLLKPLKPLKIETDFLFASLRRSDLPLRQALNFSGNPLALAQQFCYRACPPVFADYRCSK